MFYDTSLGCVTKGPPSGLVCPGVGVATAIETASPVIRPLNASGPPGQLSAPFSFQILIVRAHGSHADLIVDHIDAREAVETKATNASLDWPMN